ncbi:MAG: hypothetical protein ABIJ41_02745 [Candidatus Omnitrophota bacterium]
MKNKAKNVSYYLDEQGRFIIENYNDAEPFSNFFPGIAGLWGIPMWVFTVNRGQCIASFGVEGKDKAIMEFQPANKAYRLTSLQGFRTFIKIKKGRKPILYEPFQNNLSNGAFKRKQRMMITSHDLTIEETNVTLGLVVRVNYFTLPEEPYAALVRDVTIENVGTKRVTLEVIDGMPEIIPFGLIDRLQKDISHTVEAWKQVLNLENKAPYYNLKVVISDRPQVKSISEGHFYFSLLHEGRKPKPLNPIIDPLSVFGNSTDFLVPEAFMGRNLFKVPLKQKSSNRSLCAMTFASFALPGKKKERITSLFGHTHSVAMVQKILARARNKNFIDHKAKENQRLIQEIKNNCFTSSSSAAFNQYCQQTFLDNVMRGGLPLALETQEGKIVFNVYSRKHGDLERDYNNFILNPTYLSQGNGNYRDVNQNRRNDVWFNRDVKDNHIVNFLSLIQADGYNPLVIKGNVFSLDSPARIEAIVNQFILGRGKNFVKELLKVGFCPGALLKSIDDYDIKLKTSPQKFLKELLSYCHKHELAEHGEGFWTDHWTYNLDLIERFLALYPEERRNLLLNKKAFSFYHNTHHVLPRDQRYVLTNHGPRQYHSVVDKGHEVVTEAFDHKLRTNGGQGPVYFTCLLVKLLCLVANKAATLDPSGVGIEMEADKPNWYDALNGLPGLMGSSISETFELKRLCQFIRHSFKDMKLDGHTEVRMYDELLSFISGLNDLLTTQKDPLVYWRHSNEIKEHYRRRTEQGIDGVERSMPVSVIDRFLQLVIQKTDKAIALAQNKHGLCVTYFIHEITDYETLDKVNPDGLAYIVPLNFQKKALPLFLEGFVHALRVQNDQIKARTLYQNVRHSPLFDKKLKMYRVNDDLSRESAEIGRASVFPAGWLENQSIWMHMENKFLLELLKFGLYDEFYKNFKYTLVPFMDPKKYGRSILESSSFIVSSAHEDASLHGRGFVARLSGTTAEWLHIWLLMNVGDAPFFLDPKGNLELAFKPVLPKWLFTKQETKTIYFDKNRLQREIVLPKNTYAFNFLGSTLVVYHNPKRRDTFGDNKASIERIVIAYADHRDPVTISSGFIPSPFANDIRDNKADRIDVYLK